MSAAEQLVLEKTFRDAGIPVKHTKSGELMVQCHDATFEYLTGPRVPILAPLTCSCAQRPYPHDMAAHRKLFESPGSYDAFDERIRFAPEGMRWPWSLRFAPDAEV